jgi:hypothetical protein
MAILPTLETRVGEILGFKEVHRRMKAKKGFESWIRRFSEVFDENTYLRDVSNPTLRALIQPGEEASMLLYELIMGVRGLGRGPRFYFLENEDKMIVMDISLFLLDQFRFEAMRRLGWVTDHPTFQTPLVDLVLDFNTRFDAIKNQTPCLSVDHPRFDEYEKTFVGDKGSFVRKLIPEVIETFDNEDHDVSDH